MHTKKQRTLAFIICMAFIVTALFSIFFIVKEVQGINAMKRKSGVIIKKLS